MSQYAALIDVTTMDASVGFRIDGPAAGGQSGHSLSAGDVNGDGVADLDVVLAATHHGDLTRFDNFVL